jgi:PAS domain-containing protein
MYEGLDKKLELMQGHLSDMPGFLFLKDLQGHILYMNDSFLQEIGCGQLSAVLGRTDAQLPWAKYSDIYAAIDRRVVRTEVNFSNQEPNENFHKESTIYATQKTPFYHNDRVVGIWGVAVEVTSEFVNKEMEFSPNLSFIDLQRRKHLKITERQKEVLYWLLKGCSSKITANQVGISYRTVEHHLTAIRENNDYASSKEIMAQVYFV